MPERIQDFTVLVVDDLKSIRNIMSQLLLRKLNMAVVEAVDGLDALEKISMYEPDLIFTDISMPNMDGVELVEAVRKNPEFQHIPIIVLTAIEDRDVIKKLLSYNILDYILKPFDTMQAVVRLKKLLAVNSRLFKKQLPFSVAEFLN
ncbi:MAG: response regulator [Ignavibacteria bacterium]|nr:response regulator [Ignavibacteria bacterium]